jgi:hypothetical protein
MSDDNSKKNKKISGVGTAGKAADVEATDSVQGVGRVAPTGGITGVGAAGSVKASRLTRTMSFEEREQLLRAVNDETQKLVKEGIIPASKASVVAESVKMAIDAGLVEGGKGKK